MSVKLGTVSLTSGGTTYSASKIIIHNEYTIRKDSEGHVFDIFNDIALIKTQRNIVFSHYAQAIQPETNFVDGGVNSVVSGWGWLKEEVLPDILQYVNVETLTNQDCQKYRPNPLYETEICTLITNGRYARKGDSGGPLVANGKQIGIVSYGPYNVTETEVATQVYTRVSSYTNWIDDIIKHH